MISMESAAHAMLHSNSEITNVLFLGAQSCPILDAQNAHIPLNSTLNHFAKSLIAMLMTMENVLDAIKALP